jgi:hypothetical protein
LVIAGRIDPETPCVVNGKPLDAIGDTRETFFENTLWDIQGRRVNDADGIHPAERGKGGNARRNEVDEAAEAEGDNDRGAEGWVFGLGADEGGE